MASSKKLVVVAIDFGTTYSGYAFSFINWYKKDPLHICANQAWNAGGQCLLSLKAPTCLLIDPRDNKTYFGYDAQNIYSDLALDEEHTKVYYFSLFKMKLHGEKHLTEDFKIEDESGKRMKAIDVFSSCIRWLKDHMLDSLRTQGTGVREDEIQWVLTVPAIWNESAKLFMRKAAGKAGIHGQSLRIALEPEAASIFCRNLPTDKFESSDGTTFTSAKPGTRYMVIDLGGGTADIAVHEVLEGEKLNEVYTASGGAWGGSMVNEEFNNMWSNITGASTFQIFKSKAMADYIDLCREFEVSKRKTGSGRLARYNVKIPNELNSSCNDANGKCIAELLLSSKVKQDMGISTVSDKLRIPEEAMQKLFQPCIDAIIAHIKDIMRDTKANPITMMLLVGGFSECPLMQQAIKRQFETENMRVIVPKEAGLAVLKGAVIYGHRPEVIASRITRYAYGINSIPPFDPSVHPEEKKSTVRGRLRCKDVFQRFMSVKKTIPVGHVVKITYTTFIPNQEGMHFEIYTSTEADPMFVTDASCNKIGELVVTINNPTESVGNAVEVEYLFGREELFMEAREVSTGVSCATRLKL